jgi:hypothetical protein
LLGEPPHLFAVAIEDRRVAGQNLGAGFGGPELQAIDRESPAFNLFHAASSRRIKSSSIDGVVGTPRAYTSESPATGEIATSNRGLA